MCKRDSFFRQAVLAKRWSLLQAELKAILEAQATQATKAEARVLATCIRQRIGLRPQTDSGMLQAEDRER